MTVENPEEGKKSNEEFVDPTKNKDTFEVIRSEDLTPKALHNPDNFVESGADALNARLSLDPITIEEELNMDDAANPGKPPEELLMEAVGRLTRVKLAELKDDPEVQDDVEIWEAANPSEATENDESAKWQAYVESKVLKEQARAKQMDANAMLWNKNEKVA